MSNIKKPITFFLCICDPWKKNSLFYINDCATFLFSKHCDRMNFIFSQLKNNASIRSSSTCRFFVWGPISWIFCLGPPNYIYFNLGGEQSLILKWKSELETLEVTFLGEIDHFQEKKLNRKNFHFEKKICSPPMLF